MKLLIYGAGGLGREIAELAMIISKWDDVIFIDDTLFDGTIVNGFKSFTYETFKKMNNISEYEIVIGIGEPFFRKKLYEKVVGDGFRLATLVHPSVHISNTNKIGKGVIIQAYSQVTVNVIIEDNVLIQDKVSVGHDTHIMSHSVVSGCAMVAGHVVIGECSYIAMSVPIIQGANIGSYTIVGLGAVVCRDIPDNVIALGNPARAIKNNVSKLVFNKTHLY